MRLEGIITLGKLLEMYLEGSDINELSKFTNKKFPDRLYHLEPENDYFVLFNINKPNLGFITIYKNTNTIHNIYLGIGGISSDKQTITISEVEDIFLIDVYDWINVKTFIRKYTLYYVIIPDQYLGTEEERKNYLIYRANILKLRLDREKAKAEREKAKAESEKRTACIEEVD